MPTDRRAYLFALAPTLVVVAVGPVLALLDPFAVSAVGPLRVVGVPFVLAGLGLVGWAVHTFARAGVPPAPATEPESLVTAGALAHTRNPLYLGTVVAAGGVAVLLASPVTAAYAGLLWLAYHLLALYEEEPALRAAFGDAHADYCESTPRWL
ncbi:methyltransferase family protein [Halorientalis litorea]|uniref:methyltransferase family protein n=1 Tax=Halorientalis litorea TaxID=2931977 RepID=UPI001FF4AD42|nr:isoprenylcysteine carboxylmethyltransferase family protein [Halorientalis litorea]